MVQVLSKWNDRSIDAMFEVLVLAKRNALHACLQMLAKTIRYLYYFATMQKRRSDLTDFTKRVYYLLSFVFKILNTLYNYSRAHCFGNDPVGIDHFKANFQSKSNRINGRFSVQRKNSNVSNICMRLCKFIPELMWRNLCTREEFAWVFRSWQLAFTWGRWLIMNLPGSIKRNKRLHNVAFVWMKMDINPSQ